VWRSECGVMPVNCYYLAKASARPAHYDVLPALTGRRCAIGSLLM
jgi:hypothetical protein